MIDYSHDNTLRFGYDGEWFNSRSRRDSVIQYDCTRATREPGMFPDECKRVATLLAEKAERQGRRLYVLQSGGLDSEVMLKTFMAIGADFTPITFRLLNGMNQHEIDFVEKFSSRHKLKTAFYDIPFNWLHSVESREFALNANSNHTLMTLHMKLMSHIWDKLYGMPVLGGGDVVIERFGAEWHYCKYEHMLAWYWHAAKNGIDGGVAFFQHTPEITLSMLKEPRIEKIALGQDTLANKLLPNARLHKYRVYHDHWPDFEKRQKFTGAELALNQFQKLDRELNQDRDLIYYDTWHVPYATFVDSISPQQVSSSIRSIQASCSPWPDRQNKRAQRAYSCMPSV